MVVTYKKKQNSAEIEQPKKLPGVPFVKGKPKTGGKKKGYKSMKTELREILQELTNTKDGKKITFQLALLNTLMHKAIIEKDMAAIKLIWEYMEGKPVQPLSGAGGGPIVLSWKTRK